MVGGNRSISHTTNRPKARRPFSVDPLCPGVHQGIRTVSVSKQKKCYIPLNCSTQILKFYGVEKSDGTVLSFSLLILINIYLTLFRSRPRKISSPTGSKDLQMVNISLRVLSRPDMTMIPAMHKELGSDFDEKVGDHAFDMISEK